MADETIQPIPADLAASITIAAVALHLLIGNWDRLSQSLGSQSDSPSDSLRSPDDKDEDGEDQ